MQVINAKKQLCTPGEFEWILARMKAGVVESLLKKKLMRSSLKWAGHMGDEKLAERPRWRWKDLEIVGGESGEQQQKTEGVGDC